MECKVCFENYDEIKVPHSLQPCNHTICILCLNKIETQTCPICKTQIKEMKPNYALIDALECLSESLLPDTINKKLTQTSETIKSTYLRLDKSNKDRLISLDKMRDTIRFQSDELIKRIIKHRNDLISQTMTIELEYNQEYQELSRNNIALFERLSEINKQLKVATQIKELKDLNAQIDDINIKLKMTNIEMISGKYELEENDSYEKVAIRAKRGEIKGECLRTTPKYDVKKFFKKCLPNNRLVGIVVSDHSLKIYDSNKGKCITSLIGHTDSIESFVYLSNERIATNSKDNTIRIWNITSGECIRVIKAGKCHSRDLIALTDDRIVWQDEDTTINIWNPNTGECIQTLKGHSDVVFDLAVMSNDQIVSGSKDKTIRIWNPNNGHCIKDRIVSGSIGAEIKIWNSTTGKCVTTLRGHRKTIGEIFTISNDKIFSYDWYHIFKVWNTNTFKCIKSIFMKQYCEYEILSNDRLALVSFDFKINIFDLNTGDCIKCIQTDHTDTFQLLSLSDGRLVTCSGDGTIKTWF